MPGWLARSSEARRAPRSVAVCIALLGLAACAPQPTQLIVVVDTDIVIPGALDQIDVEITSPTGATETERATMLSGRERLPLTVGVAPSGERLGPIDVVAIGRRSGAEVARRHHRVTLLRSETRVLALHLPSACASIECAPGQTCGERGCTSVQIDASSLPAWTGSPPRFPSGDASIDLPRDAGDGGDAGGRLDASTDAPDTPPECDGPADCDDGDRCTDDACSADGCVSTPNADTCDDGDFCNGVDTCAAGECVHSGPPCPPTTLCSPDAMTCSGCVDEASCPPPSTTAWSACDYGGDPCREDGPMRTRTVTSFTCELSGLCGRASREETEPCARDTDGQICGARTCAGAWSECTFASPCDTTGSRVRACSGMTCVAGACSLGVVEERMECSRSADGIEGSSCGEDVCTDWSACAPTTPGVCTTAGTQSRTCRPLRCVSAECAAGEPRPESQACTAPLDGQPCDDAFVCTENDRCSLALGCAGDEIPGCVEP
jgi:hypothetical protein